MRAYLWVYGLFMRSIALDDCTCVFCFSAYHSIIVFMMLMCSVNVSDSHFDGMRNFGIGEWEPGATRQAYDILTQTT